MQQLLHPGTHPDAPDARDRRFTPQTARSLPPSVDLSSNCGPVYDQGMILSCSANALASAMQLLAAQKRETIEAPSRLFMYYNAREASGEAGTDSGTTMRNAIKAAAKLGACSESLWPYDPATVLQKPQQACYDHADVRTIIYERIDRNIEHLHAALAQNSPFVFAISAYPGAFTQASTTGELKIPAAGDECMGGHALIALGYDVARKAFLARNSLGATFARNGFFWVDDAYFTDPKLSYDFWSIRGIDPA
jgi:C1A family cysteine protease